MIKSILSGHSSFASTSRARASPKQGADTKDRGLSLDLAQNRGSTGEADSIAIRLSRTTSFGSILRRRKVAGVAPLDRRDTDRHTMADRFGDAILAKSSAIQGAAIP
ncbi:MAG: hypothetical protein Q7J57_16275 [Gemmobacter sp.]|nr:hypothetical protein [Gemmobacter sp.]